MSPDREFSPRFPPEDRDYQQTTPEQGEEPGHRGRIAHDLAQSEPPLQGGPPPQPIENPAPVQHVRRGVASGRPVAMGNPLPDLPRTPPPEVPGGH